MGHGITHLDSLFTVREAPWHGIGPVLADHPTREEAQQLAHPWEPVEAPVFIKEPYISPHLHTDDCTPHSECEIREDLGTEYGEVEGYKVIQRSDNGLPLGVVRESLGIVTNNDMWDVAEALLKSAPDAVIETAGSLEEGRKVWALLRLKEPLQISRDPNGATACFLALQNAHDGTASFRAQALNTRIVCMNTSRAADVEAKRNGCEFTFRNSKNVSERIDEAKAAVSMWRDGIEQWRNAMDHLIDVKVDGKQVMTYIEAFQPMPPEELITDRVRDNVMKARREFLEIYESPTQEGIANTAYGLVQASLEWRQHVQRVRASGAAGRMEARFKRSMLSTDTFGRDCIDLALEVSR